MRRTEIGMHEIVLKMESRGLAEKYYGRCVMAQSIGGISSAGLFFGGHVIPFLAHAVLPVWILFYGMFFMDFFRALHHFLDYRFGALR